MEDIFIFVWKATEQNNARSEAFMSKVDAWVEFRESRVCRWPDFIIQIIGEPTDNSNIVMKPIDFAQQMMG